MNLRKITVASMAAFSLVVVPAVAHAAKAQTTAASKLSVRAAPAVRQGAIAVKGSNLAGGGIFVAFIAAAAVIAGIAVAADGSNTPSSPA